MLELILFGAWGLIIVGISEFHDRIITILATSCEIVHIAALLGGLLEALRDKVWILAVGLRGQ